MATLVNGNGNVAVYAQQDADLLTGALGASTRIMNVGSKMAYTIEDANTIAVADGVILTKEGRRIQVDVGNVDEFTIPTGSAGVTRYYIIGYHLYTDGSANQKCETFVQLMSNGSETITENIFRNGASEVYVSLYRVKQIGLNLDTITALLSVGIALTDMTDVIGDTDISGIGDGTLTGGLNAVNQNLTEKVSGFTESTYSAVTGLAYDATSKKLGLKVGADTVIPFSGGGNFTIDALEISFSGFTHGSSYNQPWGCIAVTDRDTNTISNAITATFTGNSTATISGGTYMSTFISSSGSTITFKKRCKAIAITTSGVVAETTYNANSTYSSPNVYPCMVIVTEDLEDNIKVSNADCQVMDSLEVNFGGFGLYNGTFGDGAVIQNSGTGLATMTLGTLSNGASYPEGTYTYGMYYSTEYIRFKKKCKAIVCMASESPYLGYCVSYVADINSLFAGLGRSRELFAIVFEDLSE